VDDVVLVLAEVVAEDADKRFYLKR
jgi:hypothetical protein